MKKKIQNGNPNRNTTQCGNGAGSNRANVNVNES